MADYVKGITLAEVYAHFGYCSFCGADNFATSRFCCQCGRPLDSGQAAIHMAAKHVEAYIIRGEDDKNSFARAADDVLCDLPFGNVFAETIVEGLKKEFADREFPDVSKRDERQLKFLDGIGIKLDYKRINRITFGITVTTERGSVYAEEEPGVVFPSPFDVLNALYLTDPTDAIKGCRIGKELADHMMQKYMALKNILTNAQIDRLWSMGFLKNDHCD